MNRVRCEARHLRLFQPSISASLPEAAEVSETSALSPPTADPSSLCSRLAALRPVEEVFRRGKARNVTIPDAVSCVA
jgi:hypothetical protein